MERHLRFLSYEPREGRLNVYRPMLGWKVIRVPVQSSTEGRVWVVASRHYVLSSRSGTYVVVGEQVRLAVANGEVVCQHPARRDRFLVRMWDDKRLPEGYEVEMTIDSTGRTSSLNYWSGLPGGLLTYVPLGSEWILQPARTGSYYAVVRGRNYEVMDAAWPYMSHQASLGYTYPECPVLAGELTIPMFPLGGIITGTHTFRTRSGRDMILPKELAKNVHLDDCALWSVWDRWLERVFAPVLSRDLVHYLADAAWPDFGAEKKRA